MKFRAAYVSYADYGGPLIHTKEFVRSFKKLMPDLVTYCPYLEKDVTFRPPGSESFFNSVFAYFPVWLRQLKLELYQLRKLRKDQAKRPQFHNLFRENDIDILILRSDAFLIGAVKAAQKLGIPYLLEVNGILTKHNPDRVTRFYEKYCWENAAGLYAVCEPLADLMISDGADPQKTRVITNGVQLEVFESPDLSDVSPDIADTLRGKIIVGYVGTFTNYHDVTTLVESLKQALAEKPDLGLLLIGEGRNTSRIKSAAEKARIEDKVVFTGKVSHDHVPAYLNLCDILALPLRNIYEKEFHGAPIKLFEYMAAKKPIISTDMPSIRKLVGDSILFVPPGSVEQWKETIVALSNDEQLCKRKGNDAFNQLVACGYTWDSNAKKIYDFCDEILENFN
jgi:glycosyltransferase involved in cell wall biosynthesis